MKSPVVLAAAALAPLLLLAPRPARAQFEPQYAQEWSPASVYGTPTNSGSWFTPAPTTAVISRPRLGVYVRPLSNGVQIVRVDPGTIAQRGGLEGGDVVITVEGQQVGLVNGRLVDLADTAYQRQDAYGRARLLVRSGRTGQVNNVTLLLSTPSRPESGYPPVYPPTYPPVNPPVLPPAAGGILYGQVTTDYPVGLPYGTTLTVRLVELPRWNAAPVTVAKHSEPVTGAFPFAFRLPYAAGDMLAGRRYGLDATVRTPEGYTFTCAAPVGLAADSVYGRTTIRVARSAAAPPTSGVEAEIDRSYYRYLGRRLDMESRAYWTHAVNNGLPLADVRAHFLASTEFYDLAGSDRDRFVGLLFERALGRGASQQELSDWVARLYYQYRGNRFDLTREFLRVYGA